MGGEGDGVAYSKGGGGAYFNSVWLISGTLIRRGAYSRGGADP